LQDVCFFSFLFTLPHAFISMAVPVAVYPPLPCPRCALAERPRMDGCVKSPRRTCVVVNLDRATYRVCMTRNGVVQTNKQTPPPSSRVSLLALRLRMNVKRARADGSNPDIDLERKKEREKERKKERKRGSGTIKEAVTLSKQLFACTCAHMWK